ncbi:YadA-like family protein [Rodentibacter heidelbergensis]|uniref:Adhesin n=1 Tax=Rodentibacter heidelbergensis TaxID=1908258 RepID=A0A1V3I918_9PAST|nr:YadA-like family protein [Rodentibacter heidelbergensis]OOF36579.1 hypothetical protein BKK48_04785 [Rodentibacter heidelbergensis]
MNKTFKVIWNHAAQNWVAVSELNKAKGKTKSLSLAKKGLFKVSLISSALALMNGQAVAITGAENQLANSAVNYCYYKHEHPNGQVVCGGSSTSATGLGAIAIGNGSVANSTHGNGVVAIGIDSKIDGAMSVGLGSGNIVNGSMSNAVGAQNKVNAYYASALGFWNTINNSRQKDVSGAFGQGNQIINSGKAYAFGYDNTVGSINNAADNSLAIGSGNRVFSSNSVAVGSNTKVNASSAISVGHNTAVNASNSIAMGTNAVSNTANSVVIGANAKDTTKMGYSQATAVGSFSTAANDSVALGSGASATGHITNTTFSGWATAVGRLSNASGRGGIAVGNEAAASGIDSAAFGSYAKASANYAYSFGYSSEASGLESISFGNKAKASGPKTIAFGSESKAEIDSSVALGFRSATDATLDPVVGTSNATVNGIFYGNFAGANPFSTVSVGNVNEKRTITNVAAGRILASSTDAINGSQLYWVANNLADEIAKVKKMTWNATASENGGTATGITNATVSNGDTVTFEAGKNITITQDGRKFTIEATGSGSTTNVTVDAGEGIQVNSTTNGNNVTYTVTAKTDGTTIKIDNNGNISAVTTDLNVVGGKVEEPTGSNASALVNATTVTKAINNSGFTLKTSATPEGQKEASSTGEELITPGKAVEMVAGKNLTVKQSANGTITYATKDDVNFNSVTVGNTKINKDGVRITGGPSITTNGIDAGNKKITNVAPGEISATSKDAVNGSQLYAVGNNINNLNNRVNKIDKDLRAGIAGAAAIAGLPQVRGNGKSMMAVAASNYRGENAVALGYTRASDNGKVLLKLSGSTNTRGDVVSAVGLGYEW